MKEKSKKEHIHINHFNPDVTSLEKAHQDFPLQIQKFNAGDEFENFNEFILEEAMEYTEEGNGVTYVVWNVLNEEETANPQREVVAFYTLAATAIPYEDRIRLDVKEADLYGREFDSEICGIPALEIKLFAVDEKYQNVFYEFEGEDLPVSAWIMRSIISYADSLMHEVLGFKALFLHALPNAEHFYEVNGFNPMRINMQPLHSVDSEYTALYLALRDVHMNYDE